MAKPGKLTIEIDSLVMELRGLMQDVDELCEMMPDHQKYEAEKIRQSIGDRIGKTITAKRTN